MTFPGNDCSNKRFMNETLWHAGGWGQLSAFLIAGWSSLVARQAHNLKVAGSNPAPAPNLKGLQLLWRPSFLKHIDNGFYNHKDAIGTAHRSLSIWITSFPVYSRNPRWKRLPAVLARDFNPLKSDGFISIEALISIPTMRLSGASITASTSSPWRFR